jgi:hypothetical protein
MGFLSDVWDTVKDVGKGILGISDDVGNVVNTVGQVVGYRDDKDAVKWEQKHLEKLYKNTGYWNRTQLAEAVRQFNQMRADNVNQAKIRVRDAKKAGLHPLFALGASSNVSPTSFIPGQAPSGNIGRTGIAQRAANIATTLSKYAPLTEMEKAQLQEINSSTAQNLATAAYYNSRAQREAQNANSAPARARDRQDLTTINGKDYIKTPYGLVEVPDHTPQQAVEDEYGGIVGEVYGVSRLIGETASKARKATGRALHDSWNKKGWMHPRGPRKLRKQSKRYTPRNRRKTRRSRYH